MSLSVRIPDEHLQYAVKTSRSTSVSDWIVKQTITLLFININIVDQ